MALSDEIGAGMTRFRAVSTEAGLVLAEADLANRARKALFFFDLVFIHFKGNEEQPKPRDLPREHKIFKGGIVAKIWMNCSYKTV